MSWTALVIGILVGSCTLDRSGLLSEPAGSGGTGALGAGGQSASGGDGGGGGIDPSGGMGGTGGSPKSLGAPCNQNAECDSQHCVDGVCCDTACEGTCKACIEVYTGSADGTCDFVVAGEDPDEHCSDSLQWCDGAGACSKKDDGVLCESPDQCLSGYCVDGVCCISECTDDCLACSETMTNAPDGTCSGVLDWTDPNGDCSQNEFCDPAQSCSKKPDGESCLEPAHCESNGCCGGTCDSCCNGVQDGNETDMDCGGPNCTPCAVGDDCDIDGDCGSGICCTSDCASGRSDECLPMHCGNNTIDMGETGVDCGGGTCPKCPAGEPCNGDDDCINDCTGNKVCSGD